MATKRQIILSGNDRIEFEKWFRKSNGCWIWLRSLSNGYGAFRNFRAHRVSYTLYRGPIPLRMHVCHHCDNPSCVRPDHLFLGTDLDNHRDKKNKGRTSHALGEKCGMHKLTEQQVREILASKEKDRALARRYGVYHSTIFKIRARQRWPHLSLEDA